MSKTLEHWHAGGYPCIVCGATIDHVHPDSSSTRYVAPQSAYKPKKLTNPTRGDLEER